MQPGGSFQVHAAGAVSGSVSFALVRREPPGREMLIAPSNPADAVKRGEPLRLTLPGDIAPGVYDLEARLDDTTCIARHCVAVGPIARAVRIVHLSNMNIGDPAAPRADERLIDEINLLAPTLIVATGDYLDVTHPDPSRGWRELTDFVCRFDAPMLMACGDHDDLALYGRFVAPGPLGMIDLGPHRGIVVFDTPAKPIDADAEQLRWVQRSLLDRPAGGAAFIIGHDESAGLLRAWYAGGVLHEMIRRANLRLYFTGGARSADSFALRELLASAAPLNCVRTPQSSSAPRDGGDGRSRFSVIDMTEDGSVQIRTLPTGQLRMSLEESAGPTRVTATIVNGHAFELDDLHARVRIRRSGEQRPWCSGGELISAVEAEDSWICRVRVSVPDGGARSFVVGADGPAPASCPAVVQIGGPTRLTFVTESSADGVTYQRLLGEPPSVFVSAAGGQSSAVTPLLRLDGNPVAYRVAGSDLPYALAHTLRLSAGQRLTLQVDMSAVRVRSGRRSVQLYWKGASQWPPVWQPLDIEVRP